MDKKEIYKLIRCWELENGEGFIEYFGDNCCEIEEDEVMEWMNKKGYISNTKLSIFKKVRWKTICDCFCGYEVEYSLFPYGECDEDANFKSELIIAEYLIERGLIDKLLEFAYEGKDWACFKNEETKQNYKEYLQDRICAWNEKGDEEYNRISNISIEEINKKLSKQNI